MVNDQMTYPTSNPDNVHDDGNNPRLYAWAQQDELTIDLIGRGVYVGYHTCIEGSVQKQHRHMIGRQDGLVMLDGGGHAWFHELDDFDWEERPNQFDRFIGTRQVRTLKPQHEVSMDGKF